MLNQLRAKLDKEYGTFGQFLERPAAGTIDLDGLQRDLMFERWAPHLPAPAQGVALTIGLQHARETPLVARHYSRQIIINPAGRILPALLPQAAALDCALLFGSPEELGTYGACDAVFSLHTLNFFERPAAVLAAAWATLKPQGLLCVATQNATTGTRELALTMGFIGSLYDIPSPMRSAGQIRFLDLPQLRRLTADASFKELDAGGIMLKTLTDGQIAALVNQGLVGEPYLRALDKLGARLPELCASVYVVAQKP